MSIPETILLKLFCDYILPYRQENGLLVDSARQVFYSRHHGQFFANPGKNMIEEADSLLRLYSYIGFGISCYRYSYMGCCYLREVTSRALHAQMLA